MATPRVSANLPPYDPKKSTLAFGNGVLPKLRRELRSTDVDVVRQALLILLSDLLHNPQHITTSCKEGIVQALLGLLNHPDTPVRYRSATCLHLFAENAIGRDYFLKLSVIPALAKLFDDVDATVRFHAYQAIEMCSRTRHGVDGVLDCQLVPVLVDKLMIEDDVSLKNVILDILHWCLQVDPSTGLNCNALKRLHPLLSHGSYNIRWRVAKCLYDLTVPYDGKRIACELNMVSSLVELLVDSNPNVRTHTTSALMSILVITEGKYAFLKLAEQGLPELVKLLNDAIPTIRLNAIKCITLIGESPEGKASLSESLEAIKFLETDSYPLVCEAAHRAYQVITWKP